ncbi:hypothetical protein PEPMIC_01122 [Parvimonas micra ATCC 33270]|uniref:Uncharacterized protein n=1 Tax=Parvimonas micra ATCC 33270 TaxID=411465 RepID=A8SLW9_9FIRM|nr:hypothetical protein PEPMIC_01122 [Parvimonas micra ATCC 33270]
MFFFYYDIINIIKFEGGINMEDINEKVLSDLEIDNEQLDLEDFFSELEVNSVFLGPGTKRT